MSEKIIYISDDERPRFQASEKVMRKLYPNNTEIISPWCERQHQFIAAQKEMYQSVLSQNEIPHLLVLNYTVFHQFIVRQYSEVLMLPNINILLTTCYALAALKVLLPPRVLAKEPKILPICTMGHAHCHSDRIKAALQKLPAKNPFHLEK